MRMTINVLIASCTHICINVVLFSARCTIYILRCQCPSVCDWSALAYYSFSNSDPSLPRIAITVHAGASTELFIVQWARGKGSSPGRVKGSSRAMLATARPSCWLLPSFWQIWQPPEFGFNNSKCHRVHVLSTLWGFWSTGKISHL